MEDASLVDGVKLINAFLTASEEVLIDQPADPELEKIRAEILKFLDAHNTHRPD